MDQSILSGEVDAQSKEYVLRRVKHCETQSVLDAEQLEHLNHHIGQAVEADEEYILTVNDQIPVRLNREEMQQLLLEIRQIAEHIQ
ncbi:hypothetical protein [Texcoconibacillus texcoconensis]|uniref:Uncharacterized protein n=1 Tax=Texcoconibacillus texcoconensis TaxID=1095777 RepID=A0A840QR54_9BACI|nr:hypothetical protein [Texcoconibacillus texcoconensis]MBB5173803.1 hypothetical protein [Texcoconibacillus texcoconensis]